MAHASIAVYQNPAPWFGVLITLVTIKVMWILQPLRSIAVNYERFVSDLNI